MYQNTRWGAVQHSQEDGVPDLCRFRWLMRGEASDPTKCGLELDSFILSQKYVSHRAKSFDWLWRTLRKHRLSISASYDKDISTFRSFLLGPRFFSETQQTRMLLTSTRIWTAWLLMAFSSQSLLLRSRSTRKTTTSSSTTLHRKEGAVRDSFGETNQIKSFCAELQVSSEYKMRRRIFEPLPLQPKRNMLETSNLAW